MKFSANDLMALGAIQALQDRGLKVPGEVAVVVQEGGESMVLATLIPGDTVGEVALVLRRKANADVTVGCIEVPRMQATGFGEQRLMPDRRGKRHQLFGRQPDGDDEQDQCQADNERRRDDRRGRGGCMDTRATGRVCRSHQGVALRVVF